MSKQEKQAPLPDGWRWRTFDSVITKIVGGGTPQKAKPEYYTGDIPWVTVKDLTSRIILDSKEKITSEAIRNSASRVVKKGSILLATRMAVGRAAMAGRDLAINQDLKAISPAKDVDTVFLYYWLTSIQTQLEFSSSGSTVKGVSLDILHKLLIPLPPLPVQRWIAEALSSVDELIEASEAETKLFRILESNIRHEILQKNSISIAKDRGATYKVGDFAKISQGYTFSPEYQGTAHGDYPYIKVSDMNLPGNETNIIHSRNWVNQKYIRDMNIEVFPKGSIIFPRVGASLRTNKKRMLYMDSVTDDNLIVASVFKSTICNPQYFFNWLKGFDISTLANDGPVPSISRKNVLNIKINLPPLEAQIYLLEIFNSFDTKFATESIYLTQLHTLKRGLLHQLLSGKLEPVQGWASVVAVAAP